MTSEDDVSEVGSPSRSADDAVPTATEHLSAPLREAPWGVNVVGYFRSELGVAEVARQMVSALDANEVPVLPVHGRTIPLSRQGHPYLTVAPAEAVFPVNVICMNADMLPEFASQVNEDFFAGRYSIGLWSWEVNRFPDRFRKSFSFVEEVWAHSEHIAAALQPLAPVPITTIRIPVQPPRGVPTSRSELGLPEQEFLFLFSFDYLSVFKRKNPLAVIEAFRRTFDAGEGARLILKCINAERDPHSHAELLSAVMGNQDIQVLDRYMPPSENDSLTALCDCYVSLHRAEGFGFVMAEAMWMGKPVIATGYSGNLDFMTPSNSLLVDYRLVPIGPGGGPYPAEGQWADPNVEHASSLMRQVFADRDGARELGARAAEDIRRSHSPDAAGEIIRRRLEAIWVRGLTRRAAKPTREREALASRIEQGTIDSHRGTGGRARGMARSGMLRAMRPFTAYQQSVNAEMASTLDELSGGMAELRRATESERVQLARLLREVRSYNHYMNA
jgi:glycosyltransferase involved in cell wall biosynthesis